MSKPNNTRTVHAQLQHEEKMHQMGFDGSDHLSKAVQQQLVPAFTTYLTAWLGQKVAGKGGKQRDALRNATTPVALIGTIALREAFSMEGGNFSTLVHRLTNGFIMEEDFQSTISGIKTQGKLHGEGKSKHIVKKTVDQIQAKFDTMERMNHIKHCRKTLAKLDAFDKSKFSTIGMVFAEMLLLLELRHNGETFTVFTMNNDNVGKMKTKTLEFTPQFNEWFNSKITCMQASAFKLMPTIIKPCRWDDMLYGGYYSKRGQVSWPFIKGVPMKYYTEQDVPKDVYEAVNAIQETPWRINEKVFKVMERCNEDNYSYGNLPTVRPELKEDHKGLWYAVTTDCVQNLPKEEWAKLSKEEIATFIKKRNASRKEAKQLASKNNALNNKLSMAKTYLNYSEFFFPHAIDFRGRVYPVPSPINPQSDKFGQALLEFAHPEPLGQTGRQWLAVHGANTWGNDKVSFGERVAFIEGMSEEIQRIAINPFKERELWADTDDAWGFLAFCFEWAKMLSISDHTKHICHLPVKLDATCSGLQHFSGILLDEFGAMATNVGRSEIRSDIYGIVAEKTKALIDIELRTPYIAGTPKPNTITNRTQLAEWEKTLRKEKTKHEADKQWKRSFYNILSRKIAKPATMCLPYGITTIGIVEDLLVQYDKGELEGAYIPKGEGKAKLFMFRWLAEKLEEAIADVVPSAVDAMDWLKKCDKVLGKTLGKQDAYQFVSPMGLSVKQQYMKQITKRIDSLFGVERIRITASSNRSTKDVNKQKCNSSIAPNFVHSQDASHLMSTVLKAKGQLGLKSFSMIHDSFGVHPSEVSDFLPIIKKQFNEMYKGERLAELKAYWEETYEVELPEAPTQGSFNIDECLNSIYIFS